MSELVILKADVVIEPLVERWYAWSHLISPATASLNIPYRHLTLLESFVSAPDIHAAACQNPSLRGGPFVDLPVTSVDEVRTLIARTKQRQAKQIAFGEGLREAYRSILKQADGFSIEKFYETLPLSVRGYVELFYTLGGYPDLRVIEPLLYKSPAYQPESQSALIYRANGDDRAFAFSTPRLSRPDAVELERPFCDDIYDYLAALRITPQPLSQVLERLEQAGVTDPTFNDFLTDVLPPRVDRSHKGGTRWRYFGHACVLVEADDGSNVLVDPLVAYDTNGELERFVLRDLPERINYIVLTHNHADHVLLETLLALRYKVDTIVVPSAGGGLADPSLKLMLQSIGFKNVIELEPLGSVESGKLSLTALPFLGEHGDLDIRTKAAWLVKAGSQNLLFAADSNNLEPMIYEHLRNLLGPIETLFIGQECQGAPFSWTYGPLLPVPIDRKKDQTRRLNGSDAERGLQVVKSLGSQRVYVYAMGAEPWLQYVTSIDPSEDTVPAVNARQLVEACRGLGLHAERLFGSADVTLPA
jgi:L-ascorbate metabolism protein UlaG (beta-lactamase superfamily)